MNDKYNECPLYRLSGSGILPVIIKHDPKIHDTGQLTCISDVGLLFLFYSR